METNERGEQMVLDSLSGAESRGEVVEAGGNEEKILASVETKGRAEQKVLDSLSVSTGELVILSCEDEVTALFGGTDSKEATTDRDKKEEFLEKKVVLT